MLNVFNYSLSVEEEILTGFITVFAIINVVQLKIIADLCVRTLLSSKTDDVGVCWLSVKCL